MAAIFSDPIKTAEFYEKNPFAKVFHTEKLKQNPRLYDSADAKVVASKWTNDTRQLVLEIGCHHGALIRRWAQTYKQTDFLGIDVTYKRVVRTALGKRNDQPLANLRSILHNAQSISECFTKNELSGVCLFFPDPWPKKRQRKHRYVNESFLKQVYEVLKPGGFFWFKSDDISYYQQAFLAAQTCGLEFPSISLPKAGEYFSPQSLLSGPKDAHMTLFERKFYDRKQTTYNFYGVKPAS